MISSSFNEIVATATLSFVLGWTFKSYRSSRLGRNLGKLFNASVNSTKLVIVVRSGLPMTKGKIASQCAHAAVSCYKEGLISCPEIVKQWESCGQPKIILRSNSTEEEELKSLAKTAAKSGLVAAIVRDAGRTQVPSGTITVLGIGPGCVNKIDEVTSKLKLL